MTLRRTLRALLETRTGPIGRGILAWRTRGAAESLLRARGLRDWSELVCRWETLEHVARGPFARMEYPIRRGDIVRHAKLLGSYERELHDALERFIARAPALVVNVGSGDGYYAVGLARRLPAARVVAVDPDPLAQDACADTARRNGVRPFKHVARVDVDGLQRILAGARGRALCVVDCEGCEDQLIDLDRAPALASADVLVETHDFAAAGVTARLTRRLERTHDVERIEVAPRDPEAYPELADVPAGARAGLLDEFRHHPQSWLACFARASH